MDKKLTVTLEGDRSIILRRAFNAPRELVFDAWTKPEHLAQWYGMRGSSLVVCEVDLCPGGSWRYVIRERDGQDYGFGGRYLEVLRPERIKHTYVFDPYPNDEAIVTAEFTEVDGGTLVTETTVHATPEGRGGHIASGFEVGAGESLARLEELLERHLEQQRA
ncbi:MAG: SRPBCC family protein [Flavobacteriales bacterium]|nr:SRPBCC family protein [Flavobacteriales bacterium]